MEKEKPEKPENPEAEKKRAGAQARRDSKKEEEKERQDSGAESVGWAFAQVASLPYKILSTENEIWHLSPDEEQNLGIATQAICDRYAGMFIRFAPELAAFVAINASIIAPRVAFMMMRGDDDDRENPGEDNEPIPGPDGGGASSVPGNENTTPGVLRDDGNGEDVPSAAGNGDTNRIARFLQNRDSGPDGK